jgi:hypothetical protein
VEIDIPFSAEDRKRLTQALGTSWNADDVATLLARAGASEILALATGRTVPATLQMRALSASSTFSSRG